MMQTGDFLLTNLRYLEIRKPEGGLGFATLNFSDEIKLALQRPWTPGGGVRPKYRAEKYCFTHIVTKNIYNNTQSTIQILCN